MASQKFDELAEKVADKAVKKIKNMEVGAGASFVDKVINNKNLNDDDQPHRYEEKKRDYEEKAMGYREREQRSNNNVDNVKPGKIIPEAVMKKEDDSGQSDSLTLKYKYLKQHAMEKKASNHKQEEKQEIERSGSEEHSPLWRNVENSDEKLKHRRPPIEEREQEPIQVHQTRHDSGEKDGEKEYERNKERSSKYDKSNDNPSNKDRERFSKGSDNESFKNRFFDEHEREQNEDRDRNPMNNERARDDSTIKQENDHNSRPQFKSIPVPEPLAQIPLKASHEDVPPTVIDLDDNYEAQPKQPAEEPKNMYKEIVDQQKTTKVEYPNDDEEEDHKIREDGNVFVDDHRALGDEISDDDDNYKGGGENDNAVTTGDGPNGYTTRKRMIRREGNRLYTYLSAPEYAEYHEMLAKQTKNPNNPFYIS